MGKSTVRAYRRVVVYLQRVHVRSHALPARPRLLCTAQPDGAGGGAVWLLSSALFAQPPPPSNPHPPTHTHVWGRSGAGSRLPGAGGADFPVGICQVRVCAARRAPRRAPRVIYYLSPRRQRCGSGAAASKPWRRRRRRREGRGGSGGSSGGVPEQRRGRPAARRSLLPGVRRERGEERLVLGLRGSSRLEMRWRARNLPLRAVRFGGARGGRWLSACVLAVRGGGDEAPGTDGHILTEDLHNAQPDICPGRAAGALIVQFGAVETQLCCSGTHVRPCSVLLLLSIFCSKSPRCDLVICIGCSSVESPYGKLGGLR